MKISKKTFFVDIDIDNNDNVDDDLDDDSDNGSDNINNDNVFLALFIFVTFSHGGDFNSLIKRILMMLI